jgi:hypothetical protein
MLILKRPRRDNELDEQLRVLFKAIDNTEYEKPAKSLKVEWDEAIVQELGKMIQNDIHAMYPTTCTIDDIDIDDCYTLGARVYQLAALSACITKGIRVFNDDGKEIIARFSDISPILEVFTSEYGWRAIRNLKRTELLRETDHRMWQLYSKLRHILWDLVDKMS